MSPIVYAIPVFLVTILVEAWVAWRRGVPTYDVPDAITSLQFGVLSQIAATFTRLFTLGIYVVVYEYARLFELPADALWVWVLAVVFYDFIYYWVHRLGHEVNLLWAAHQVHHSSEYFNLTTALRQTATGAFTTWPFYLVMAMLGFPPIVFAVAALIDLLYQYWVHTELVGKLGWVDRVFVTPSNHRVHHGQNDYCIDCNYGGILILWDRMFGTFVEERDEEKVVYGVRKPLASFNPVWGNLNVYRDLWQASRAAPSWREAIGLWFASPSGGRARIEHLDPASVRRFDCGTRRRVRLYAMSQYALLIVPTMHFIAVAGSLSPAVRVGYALIIVASALCIGWLLEERPWARQLEHARWLTILVVVMALPATQGWTVPGSLQVIIAGIAAASLIGAQQCIRRYEPA